MTPEERIGAGELAGDGFAGMVATVRDTHAAIAERAFRGSGGRTSQARLVHDSVAALAYGATGLAGRSLLRMAGRGAALAGRPGDSLDARPAGRAVRGALGGVWGDTLEARGNPLTVPMSIRAGGRNVAVEVAAVGRAFPRATERVAVFVHGLCETEDAWRLHADRNRPYGDRLRDELGYTPVYLRYNSGLHVSENGRRLSRLLGQLLEAWPVHVEELVLVGHSMGGLVARSACHYGSGEPWTGRVAHLVMLGSPHTGVPLERGAHALGWALARVPETRPLALALAARSAGIKDMGHGYLTDECWTGQDPAAFLRPAARELRFLEGAAHYFFSATVTADPDHPLGRHVGDLLVLHPSAWGQARRLDRLRFDLEHYRHLGGATHFDLLCHPAVGDQLAAWLSAGDAGRSTGRRPSRSRGRSPAALPRSRRSTPRTHR